MPFHSVMKIIHHEARESVLDGSKYANNYVSFAHTDYLQQRIRHSNTVQ